jgi:hypothetical protein
MSEEAPKKRRAGRRAPDERSADKPCKAYTANEGAEQAEAKHKSKMRAISPVVEIEADGAWKSCPELWTKADDAERRNLCFGVVLHTKRGGSCRFPNGDSWPHHGHPCLTPPSYGERVEGSPPYLIIPIDLSIPNRSRLISHLFLLY